MFRTLSGRQVAGVLVIALVIQVLLAYASFGPGVTSQVEDLPLGLVNADEGAADAPHVGEMLAAQILDAPAREVAWSVYASEAALREGMAQREVYGGLILPPSLSREVAGLGGPDPQPAEITVLVNEGMHASGADAAGEILAGTVAGFGDGLAERQRSEMAAAGAMLTVEQASVVARPVVSRVEAVHSPGDDPHRAQFPMIATVLLWLGTLLATLVLWLSLHGPGQEARPFVITQLASAVVLAVILAGSVLLITGGLLGMEVNGSFALFALLSLIGLTFLFLQGAVLNWLGFRGWPLLVLLWLFGPSVLALPPEFLAEGYRSGVYSWIPFRFTLEALQGLLFFEAGAGETARNVWIIVLYGLGGMLALVASVRRLAGKDLTENPMARRFRGSAASS